jgi:hypothetical protein
VEYSEQRASSYAAVLATKIDQAARRRIGAWREDGALFIGCAAAVNVNTTDATTGAVKHV